MKISIYFITLAIFLVSSSEASAIPRHSRFRRQSPLNQCSSAAAKLTVGLGVDPNNPEEVRFVPGGFKKDPVFGGQSSALNPAIIANFICDRLNDPCKVPADLVAKCRTAQQQVASSGKKGGKGADLGPLQQLANTFNSAIGLGGNGTPQDKKESGDTKPKKATGDAKPEKETGGTKPKKETGDNGNSKENQKKGKSCKNKNPKKAGLKRQDETSDGPKKNGPVKDKNEGKRGPNKDGVKEEDSKKKNKKNTNSKTIGQNKG